MALVVYLIYCCVDFCALAQGNAYYPQKSREIAVPVVGVDRTMFRLRQQRQLPVAQHVRSTPQRLCQKHSSNGGAEVALDTDLVQFHRYYS